MHIGEYLKDIRRKNKITQVKLRELTGLSQGYISDLENGEIKNPTDETLDKIASALGISQGDLTKIKIASIIGDDIADPEFDDKLIDSISTINEELSPYYSHDNTDLVPLVKSIKERNTLFDQENIETHIVLDKIFSNNCFAYRIKGDSMNLEFSNDSIVLVENTPVKNGDIVAVLINGTEEIIKKIVLNENIITLIPQSSNSEHTPRIYDLTKDDVKILGKVKVALKFY